MEKVTWAKDLPLKEFSRQKGGKCKGPAGVSKGVTGERQMGSHWVEPCRPQRLWFLFSIKFK